MLCKCHPAFCNFGLCCSVSSVVVFIVCSSKLSLSYKGVKYVQKEYAEVECKTFFIICYLIVYVYGPDSFTVCNLVPFSVELENIKPPCEGAQSSEGNGIKTPKSNSISLQETPSRITASVRIPRSESVSCSGSAQTEKK